MSRVDDNPLRAAARESASEEARKSLRKLREHWASAGDSPLPVPLVEISDDQSWRDWLPPPAWISGWDAFQLLQLQTKPYEWAPAIARTFQVISDQVDRDRGELNYSIERLPPNHDMLEDFPLGTHHWFRAAHLLLTVREGPSIDGWEAFVSDIYDWLGPYGSLRLRSSDVLENALAHHWSVEALSLPEAKQEPIWSFPRAMAWIATRDYLALARLGNFRRPSDEDEAVATEGVCRYNTEALGWLHTAITFTQCECGALNDYQLEAYKHCTCISIAWEELVHFNGGLTNDTPELIFNLQEGWISMTWPDGADELRYLRRDILERWPARPATEVHVPALERSTIAGEQECRDWLLREFAADPERRRSKKDFRVAALKAFSDRLSERGFNLRVWPELAREHRRDGAGAKRKS